MNLTTAKCQACPVDKPVWSSSKKVCEDNPINKESCAQNKSEYNVTTKKCEPCPPLRPVWN